VGKLIQLQIDWFAITDHNSMANCPAYEQVSRVAGLSFTWGVEIQSVEEIHLLAYFDDSDQAQRFDAELYDSLIPIDNDPEFFGDQVIIDENDNILKLEQRALINSSIWDLNKVTERVSAYGGIVVPAHIDAEVNSILSQLGFLPPEPCFDLLGITSGLDLGEYLKGHPELSGKAFLRCSDAHYLSDLSGHVSTILTEAATAQELVLAARQVSGRSIQST